MEHFTAIQNKMIPYSVKQAGKKLMEDGEIIQFYEKDASDHFLTYFIDQNVVEDAGNGNYACSCADFQMNAICKHIYATHLKMEREKQKVAKQDFKNRILTQESNTLLSLFQQNMAQQLDVEEDNTNKTELATQYIIRLKPDDASYIMTIEVKVGTERTYVVKNMNTFLAAVRDRQWLVFTKNFAYDPNEHFFAEADKVILEKLLQISEIAKIYDTDTFYWNKSYAEEKNLTIPPSMASSLLELLSKRDTTCIIMKERVEDIKYRGLAVRHDKLDFIFELKKSADDKYQLEMEDLQQAIFFEAYQLLFFDGTFFIPTHEVWESLKPLIEFHKVTKNEVVQFSESQLSEVVSYVLPALQKSGKLKLADSIEGRITQQPLDCKLFIALEYGEHTLRLEYHYGNQQFDPFVTTEEENEKIMIRDVEKEARVMNILESAPVHFSGTKMVVNKQEKDLYQFYYRTIPKLAEFAEIYMEDGLEEMVEDNVRPVTTLDVSGDNDYLSVTFDFKGIPDEEVQNILESLREKRSYHRLKNGRFLSLESENYKQMENVLQMLEVRKKDIQSNMQVPLYRGMQIYDILGAGTQDEHHKFSRSFRELLTDITTQSEDNFALPAGLKAELRDYQLTGFEWMKSLAKYNLGGILADDMGLGKTVQTISFLASELEEKPDLKPVLIVTPASLLYNWQSELEKFAPDIPVTVLHGTKESRLVEMEDMKRGHVYLISYPSLRQDILNLVDVAFSSVIIDESQAIKNYHTKASQAVRALKRNHVFALSGTPLENSIDELWAIYQTLMPGFFPSLRKFKEIPYDKIATMIRPFLLRRLKQDVVKELPDKIETNLYSELTDEQKTIYLAYLEKIQADLAESNGNASEERIKLLAGLTRLRQICCDPSLFVENYQGESGKLLQLFDTIQTARENGKRLLIFSQFTGMLAIIRRKLEEDGQTFFYMDGKTPAKTRLDMVNSFNEGENDIFLISLKAGGTGLNLVGADTVILYDLWWNPAVEEQATGRAHRIGQKRVVQVFRMITKGTIEERIFDLQKKKQALVDELIQPGEQMLGKLSTEEIKQILQLDNGRDE
ncbi:DEAD/DEAH box helicase [Listeria seeligeri]|uniref:DEAD/DEAH box helicase n=1 Tax=Listeria seeligeri TaxID=1640 RepID=UPI001628C83B|nr:DEAD/DEAH box helicase [Listeria seeligeri]MBC1472279.1 DEAD/DEAH box helicase family protein [Listeria seeligeri]